MVRGLEMLQISNSISHLQSDSGCWHPVFIKSEGCELFGKGYLIRTTDVDL